MVGQVRKISILFGLGEVHRSRTDWLDYSEYGIGEDDVDDLINLVTDVSLHSAPTDSNEVWVPLHAWRALGQMRNQRAIGPLLRMFDALWEDDWALEELPQVLAMIGPDAIGPLTDFIDDDSHAEFARAMAVSSLEKIAESSPEERDLVVTIITDYLENPDEISTDLNGCAVSSLITLQAKESIDTVRRLYASGNVDISICGDIEDVEMEFGLRTQRSTPSPNYSPSVGAEIQSGGEKKKIGRNEPCPCGSGKKYKKCCLH